MSGPRKTQAERRTEAERRILDAALQLIAKQGITKMSFAELGEAAGFSRGLATHYFGSKEGLIVRLLNEIAEQFVGGLRTPEFESASGLNKILLYIELYLERAKSRPWIARALQLLRAESLIAPPALQEAVAITNQTGAALLSAAVRSGQEAGEIRSDIDPAMVTILVTGSLRGIVGQYLASPEEVDLDGLSRELQGMIGAGLRASPTS